MENSYKKVIDMIASNDTFLICAHTHPDGDGIGSTLALGLALESKGKKVVMYNEDPVPKALDFLPSSEKIVNRLEDSARFDVSIMVDCSQPERAGKDFPSSDRRGVLVCIDHHVSESSEAQVACLDKSAASAGEVVYNILKRMCVEIDEDLATMILTTIIIDTGFFRYSNTSYHSLSLAAELVRVGASTWNISKNLEERVSPNQYKLLSSVLETVDYLLDGRLAVMVLTQQMFKMADADVEMADDFINFPRSVLGVSVAALIREKTSREFKISFRSKDSIDVAKLAKQFDGGGHEHAAGCTIKGSLGDVKRIVVKAVEKELKETNND